MDAQWHPIYGDRRQELVFIGSTMDEATLRRALDACLIGDGTDDPTPAERWPALADPFPLWQQRPENPSETAAE